MSHSFSPWEGSLTVLYVLEKNVVHSKWRPLQELLLPKPVFGFGQESKTQQVFLLFQEMIQYYFQPFL